MVGATVLCCVGILMVLWKLRKTLDNRVIAATLNVKDGGKVELQVDTMTRGGLPAPMWQVVLQQLGTMSDQALQPLQINAAVHLMRNRVQRVWQVQYLWLKRAENAVLQVLQEMQGTEDASPAQRV